MKIAIASGKGGTGKTTLATNLATYLAEEVEIGLVDLDVEEPNSGLFIKGELVHEEDKYKMIPEWKQDQCTLCGLCQEVCNFHAVIQLIDQIMLFSELCHSCYACSELCPTSALPMVPQKMGEMKHYRNANLSFVESRLDIGQEQAVPLMLPMARRCAWACTVSASAAARNSFATWTKPSSSAFPAHVRYRMWAIDSPP